jgi:tRNA U34 5-carboxymethylaminomethyl modifying GTPase MnmE/TrmE
MKALQDGLTLDLTAMLLRSAAESLAEITGQSVSEEIVQAVFSRFCVGK